MADTKTQIEHLTSQAPLVNNAVAWKNILTQLSPKHEKKLPEYAKIAALFEQNLIPKVDKDEKGFVFLACKNTCMLLDNMNCHDSNTLNAAIEFNEAMIKSSREIDISERMKMMQNSFVIMYNAFQNHPKDLVLKMKILSASVKKLKNKHQLSALGQTIDFMYVTEGKIDADMIKGIAENVLPMMNKGKSFIDDAFLHDCNAGEYGILCFNFKAMTSKTSPDNLNDLINIFKEIPSADQMVFEQNRTDAILIDDRFPLLRDSIHGEFTGADKMVAAMVDFYDDNSYENQCRLKEALLPDCKDYFNDYTCLNMYDSRANNNEKVIDVLRRLKENTKKDFSTAPKINDEKIDTLCAELSYNDKKKLEEVLDAINEKIIKDIESPKVGIDVEFIKLLSWVDKKAASALREQTFEQQSVDFKEPWFKQMVLFSELTNSTAKKFDAKEFGEFYADVENARHFSIAYKMIANRQNQNIISMEEKIEKRRKHLGQYIDEKPNIKADEKEYQHKLLSQMFGDKKSRMWSGNLLKELQVCAQLKPAETRIGQRYREEAKHKINIEIPVENKLIKIFSKSR